MHAERNGTAFSASSTPLLPNYLKRRVETRQIDWQAAGLGRQANFHSHQSLRSRAEVACSDQWHEPTWIVLQATSYCSTRIQFTKQLFCLFLARISRGSKRYINPSSDLIFLHSKNYKHQSSPRQKPPNQTKSKMQFYAVDNKNGPVSRDDTGPGGITCTSPLSLLHS